MGSAARADASRRAGTHSKYPMSGAKLPAAAAIARPICDSGRAPARLNSQHRRGHWYQRRTLLAVHDVVERVPVCDIHKSAPTVEGRQCRKRDRLRLRREQASERRFDQLGHGPARTSRFPPEPSHDGVVDVERRLHMANHIFGMAGCQFSGSARPCYARAPRRRRLNVGRPLTRNTTCVIVPRCV